MDIEFETDWEVLILTPLICAQLIRCGDPDCGATHGFAINIGWLFWALTLHFPEASE